MKQAIKLFFLALLATFLLPPVSSAQNMADGLQCPSDWNRSRAVILRWDVNNLLKQCTPPTNDAVIMLYSKSTSDSLLTELNKWTQNLKNKGLPYQRFLNEQPGHVSGYPAILRFFSGWDRDGRWYDSYLVVSRYRGTNYIFIGYAMKGHDRVRIQMRNAMNAWHYPGVLGPTNSGYSSTNNQNQQGPGPVISQNINPDTNLNINPTINVNRPGCTRQPSPEATPPLGTYQNDYDTGYPNSGHSYPDNYDTGYPNSGSTHQYKQDTNPDNNNSAPDNSKPDTNNQNTARPADDKFLDYMLK